MNGITYCRASSKEQIEGTMRFGCPRRSGFHAVVATGRASVRFTVLGSPRNSRLAAFGNIARLPRHALAVYGIRHGTHRRGTSRIPGDLETNFQGESFAQQRAALRLPT